jgi:hypothetical protein
MKIFTKVPDFTGIRASVMFVNGQGDTDDPRLIEWFKRNGYSVADGESKTTEVEEKITMKAGTGEAEKFGEVKLQELKENQSIEFPHFPSMSVDEIRAWAKEHGLGIKIKATKDKDKLIRILTE